MFVLEYIADLVDVPVDQVIFLFTQVISIPAAVFFRLHLSPTRASCATRHAFGAFLGLMLLYWSYGWYFLHMVAQCVGVYAIMVALPQNINYKLAFLFSMAYLLYIQITRIRGVPDFASPVMFSTTKLSGMAFSIHDGVHKKKEDLSPYQQKYAIRKYPSFFETLGYVFHFSGLICGPSFFFRDYMDFISGENYFRKEETFNQQNNNSNGKEHRTTDDMDKLYRSISPTTEVIKKVLVAFACALVHLFISTRFPVELNGDMSFINSHGFWYRLMYIFVSMILVRYRYYFAWVIGEAIQNAAGFGLHFVDGKPQWDMNPNINIWDIDKATSVKIMTDNWNISSAKWLRLVSYERSGKYRVAWTFLLSSLWHGIEPGFYVTFGTIVFMTLAARRVRKHVRPLVVDTKWKLPYDILTWMSAYMSVSYSMGGFHLLHWQQTFNFFTYSMYWWMHILLIFLIIVPFPSQKVAQKDKLKKS